MGTFVALKSVYHHSRCASHWCTYIPSEIQAQRWVLWSFTSLAGSMFSQNNFRSSDPRAVFNLASVHFKWALTERRQQHFWITFTYGFSFAWQSFDLHYECMVKYVDRDWCLKVFLSLCNDFLKRIIPVFNAVPPEGLKNRDIHYSFSV